MIRRAQMPLAVLGLALLNAELVLGPIGAPPLRVVTGLLFALVVPGWTLTAVFFPRRGLDGAERVLLALGLSVAGVICTGVLLDASRPGLRPSTWTIGLSVLAVGAAAVTAFRERGTPLARRLPRMPWAPLAAGVLAAGVVAVLLAVAGHDARHQRFPPFTQLSALGVARADGSFRIAVASHERAPTTYSLRAVAHGTTLKLIRALTLRPGQSWSTVVTAPGNVRPLRVMLYRGPPVGRPYRFVTYRRPCPIGTIEDVCTPAEARHGTG